MATTYLSRTSGTPTDSKKTTLSVWLKRSGLGTGTFFGGGADSNNHTFINFNPNGKIFLQSSSGGSNTLVFVTTQVFRDTSAWYHIVVAIDTTQGTASNRVKLYVNGVQVTAFDTETQPSQNLELEWNKSGKTLEIGKYLFQSTYSIYDGSMSHFNFIDGTQELPTVFGETDSTTGEWKIKTSLSVTYGNNGFFILKDGNSVTDQSGNSNNWTLAAGTLTNTEDCPSNNFATWNKSIGYTDALTNGNTTVTRSASGWRGAFSSLPLPTTGKFYCEFKISSGSNLSDLRAGIADDSFDGSIDLQNRNQVNQLGEQTNGISYTASNGNSSINASEASYGSAISTSNVLGMAVDMTNMKLYFSKDGVFQNSGDPTSGATGTGALAIPATLGKYFVAVGVNTSAWHVNFGNGTFGTTAITSAGTPGSTPGEFEYDVPTGYQPLTTKGLNA
jgi:hypothetical protein